MQKIILKVQTPNEILFIFDCKSQRRDHNWPLAIAARLLKKARFFQFPINCVTDLWQTIILIFLKTNDAFLITIKKAAKMLVPEHFLRNRR